MRKWELREIVRSPNLKFFMNLTIFYNILNILQLRQKGKNYNYAESFKMQQQQLPNLILFHLTHLNEGWTPKLNLDTTVDFKAKMMMLN